MARKPIHYILIGGSGEGPRRIADWILTHGWFYLYERRIVPVLDRISGVFLRCPLGRDETDPRIIEYGAVDSRMQTAPGEFNRVTGCLRHPDARVQSLCETLPAFIEFLAGICPVYCHVGSLADDPWGNHLRATNEAAYRRWFWTNTAIYRGATLSLDHCAELPADRLSELRKIKVLTGHSPIIEGRRRRAPEFAHLNDPRIGSLWEERGRLNPDIHLYDHEIKGRKFALLEPAPDAMNKAEWQQAMIDLLPDDTEYIMDARN